MMKIKKNRKIMVLFFIIFFMLALSSCKKDEIMQNYTQLTDKNHIYKEVEVTDVLTKLENHESFYLIMGFPECPWCQALMPVLNEVAKDNHVEQIYYLNLKEIRDNEQAKGHVEYLRLANDYFYQAIDEANNRLNAPTFVKVVDGVMIKYHLNTVEGHVKNDHNVLPPLTNEQEAKLKDLLKEFFV